MSAYLVVVQLYAFVFARIETTSALRREPLRLEQRVPHLHLRLVKLRFRRADGAAQQLGDLVMLVAVNGMKDKYRAAARREFRDRPAEHDAVDGAGQIRITLSKVVAHRRRV